MTQNSVMVVDVNRSYDGSTQKSTRVDPYIEDNVVYLHKIEDLTDSEKTAAQTALNNETAAKNREERNRRLAETDWMACSDVTMAENWKTYRQALRDITKHSNWPNLKVPDMDGSGAPSIQHHHIPHHEHTAAVHHSAACVANAPDATNDGTTTRLTPAPWGGLSQGRQAPRRGAVGPSSQGRTGLRRPAPWPHYASRARA